jgi:pimeloyl-ACP methyl ester carboxylesterase
MSPTADRLRARGMNVQVPDVLGASGSMPRWSEWPEQLETLIALEGDTILVGYSASADLAAALASRLPTRGIIFLDGVIPVASGPAQPGSGRLRALVRNIASEDGQLPSWLDWFPTDNLKSIIGIDELALDEAAYQAFLCEQPAVALDWFDDTIDIAAWDNVPAGYIQTSRFYEAAAEDAQRRGWPVVRLEGTHLHPTLKPEETAIAIAEICRNFR